MPQTYFTTLTDVGLAALANTTVLGQPLLITHFAVGDGGGPAHNPDVETLKKSSKLVNEVYRGAVNELKVDENNSARYYIEGVVPVAEGGWTVREAGWFLDDGTLFAVTKFPPSYKSVPSDGAATELPVRTYLATGVTDNIQLKIDPTVVIATRNFVVDSINELKSAANPFPQYQLTKPTFITGSAGITLGQLNIFTEHKELNLPSTTDGAWLIAKVDPSVDLESGECAFTAPDGETIHMNGEQYSRVRIVEPTTEFRFYRHNGAW
ncbi:MAG: phage tail protein, partial [Porticoccaceae bacterium]|nr:phage tail protein [Porticoccaceae bacterium]